MHKKIIIAFGLCALASAFFFGASSAHAATQHVAIQDSMSRDFVPGWGHDWDHDRWGGHRGDHDRWGGHRGDHDRWGGHRGDHDRWGGHRGDHDRWGGHRWGGHR
jgi:hypothetical protein